MRAYCKECRHFRYCLKRTRDIPCTSYVERRKQDGRRKRADSPGARDTGALERTPGTAPETEEKGLPAAAGADHEPDPAGDHLHHGGGDLGDAGGAGVKGGEDDAELYIIRVGHLGISRTRGRGNLRG